MEHLSTLFLATTDIATEAMPDFHFGRELLKMGVGLALLFGLLFAAIYGVKRLGKGRIKAFNGSHIIQILERRPIGPKAILYLISLRGREILIAYSPQGITPLHPLGTPAYHPSFEEILDEKLKRSP